MEEGDKRLTPSGRKKPLNVAPPDGTTRGSLVITPKESLGRLEEIRKIEFIRIAFTSSLLL